MSSEAKPKSKPKSKRIKPRTRVKKLSLKQGQFRKNPDVEFRFQLSMSEVCEIISFATGRTITPYDSELTKEKVDHVLNLVSRNLVRLSIAEVLSRDQFLQELHSILNSQSQEEYSARYKRNSKTGKR